MLKSNYVSRTFWDQELNKVENDFGNWIGQIEKEKGFEVEIIASNMFSAPMPLSSTKNAFFIYVLFKETKL